MIHHVVVLKARPEADLEMVLRETRVRLVQIPGVQHLRCGKNIDPKSPWSFFLSMDFETMAELETYRTHPLHVAYIQEILTPYTSERTALDFELP